ncbi:Cuticle protein 10.9 [Nymphon striatum]|nr:Cuticle protein 10.9 [Nymphon striatum]
MYLTSIELLYTGYLALHLIWTAALLNQHFARIRIRTRIQTERPFTGQMIVHEEIFVFCLLAVSAYGFGYGYQPREVRVIKVEKVAEPVDKPEPYEFSYSITDEDSNTQSRQESGDANGHMKGGYRITLANGITRWVQYVANGDGFTATVETNEPGTDSQSPADVTMNANPIEIKEAPKKIIAPNLHIRRVKESSLRKNTLYETV